MIGRLEHSLATPSPAWLYLLLTAVVTGLLVGLAWPLGALLVLTSSLVIIGILWPGAIVALVVLSIPIQGLGSIGVGTGGVTATRLIVGALIVSYLVNIATGRARPRLVPVAWAHGLVVGVLVASIVNVIEPGLWASEIYRWGIAGVVFVVADDALQRPRARVLVIFATGLGVILASVVGFVQVIHNAGPPSYVAGGVLRAYSTFGAPNAFAAYLELGLPLLAALSVVRWDTVARYRWLRWWCASAAVIGGIALLLTQSRGGFLGIVAALFFLALAGGGRVRVTTLVLCVGLSMTLLLPIGDRFQQRSTSLAIPSSSLVEVTPENWANLERTAHWGAGLRMTANYPLSGVGAGHFNVRFREHTPVWRFRIPRGHAHNGYIHMGAQAGYPGLMAMVLFTATLLVAMSRGVARARSRQERAVALGSLGIVVAFSVHSIVDYLNVLSLGLQLAVMVALVTAMSGRVVNDPQLNPTDTGR